MSSSARVRSRFFLPTARAECNSTADDIGQLLADIRRQRLAEARIAQPAPSGDDTCAICLEVPSPAARLEGCSHTFCESCLERWCTQCSKCPLCKREVVAYMSASFGRVAVPHRDLAADTLGSPGWDGPGSSGDESALHNCQLCGGGELPDEILLCDGCDCGFHLLCLDPPLSHVPAGEWHCPDCIELRRATEAEQRRRGARAARAGMRARAMPGGDDGDGHGDSGCDEERFGNDENSAARAIGCLRPMPRGQHSPAHRSVATIVTAGSRARRRRRAVVSSSEEEEEEEAEGRQRSAAKRPNAAASPVVLCPATPALARTVAASGDSGGRGASAWHPLRAMAGSVLQPVRQPQHPRLALLPAQPTEAAQAHVSAGRASARNSAAVEPQPWRRRPQRPCEGERQELAPALRPVAQRVGLAVSTQPGSDSGGCGGDVLDWDCFAFVGNAPPAVPHEQAAPRSAIGRR